MPLIQPIIRPPAEAGSFLLQVTTGCSSNGCSFCGAYTGKPFGVKDPREVEVDIEQGRRLFPGTRRVFLLDGDALAAGNDRLVPVLEGLARAFPGLTRVSSYANGYNIEKRSEAELRELRDRKLGLVYIGLESGDQGILDSCGKRSSAEEMIGAVIKAARCGIRSSVIVLLGLGGRARSREHVRGTVRALNRMQPRYLSFLSLMLIPGTGLFERARRGEFEELGPDELLGEARDIIGGLDLAGTVFRCDHASNHLPLRGRLPRDRDRLSEAIDAALRGEARMMPEALRGL